jgi:hypothetical protein
VDGKHPDYFPKVKEGSDYSFNFDSDIPIYEKEEFDNEIKSLRTWNLNADLAQKKQAKIFYKPAYEIYKYGLFPRLHGLAFKASKA